MFDFELIKKFDLEDVSLTSSLHDHSAQLLLSRSSLIDLSHENNIQTYDQRLFLFHSCEMEIYHSLGLFLNHF